MNPHDLFETACGLTELRWLERADIGQRDPATA